MESKRNKTNKMNNRDKKKCENIKAIIEKITKSKDIGNRSREVDVVEIKQMFMYLCNTKTNASLRTIGEVLGGYSHCNVRTGAAVFSANLESNQLLMEDMYLLALSVIEGKRVPRFSIEEFRKNERDLKIQIAMMKEDQKEKILEKEKIIESLKKDIIIMKESVRNNVFNKLPSVLTRKLQLSSQEKYLRLKNVIKTKEELSELLGLHKGTLRKREYNAEWKLSECIMIIRLWNEEMLKI